jgi:spoIIIJ-associated protein
MLSAEGIGKNIEQAIENALFELKAPREDVDIKIISEGGLFKKARVVVTISDDAKSKYIRKNEIKTPIKTEEIEEKTHKTEEKIEKIAKNEEKTEEIKEKVKEVQEESEKSQEEVEETEKSEVKRDYEVIDPKAFLTGLLEVAGKQNFEIKVTEEENSITYSVEGEDLGDLIGHRGECYYAITRIITAVSGNHKKKIFVDIGGYREKRAEVLTALAKKTADKVAKTGRYMRLDPMNPAERRVIHSALSEDNRVVTLSKGEDPHRYVMIFPKDDND